MIYQATEAGQAKKLLREEFRSFRRSLSEEERAGRSALMVARLPSLPEVQAAQTVHVYWPMLDRGEIDTRPFIQWLTEQGKRVVMPVIRDFSISSDTIAGLEHRCFTSETELKLNQWGVLEPVDGACVPPQEIDVVIVPALGVGRNGQRIGYGRGHYDAFLRDLRATTICLVYSECAVPFIPGEPHDVPVSIIITEQEIIRA